MELFKKAEAKAKPRKASHDIIQDASMDEICDLLIRTSRDLKNAKAAHENAQAEIIDYMSPKHLDNLKKGSLAKTFKLNEKVMCIFTDRFKNLNDEERAEVEKRLSDAKIPIEKLFTEKLSLKLNPAVEENYEKLKELHALLGPEKFEEFFAFKVNFTPVDDFYKSVVKENAVEVLEDVIENIRYKPTVKVS